MKSSRTPKKLKHSGKVKKSPRVEKKEKIQDAPGDLQKSKCDEDNQSSQGALKNESQTQLSNFEKSVEPVPISNIQHFSSIPDFIDRTLSPHPIVVKTPSSLQCIDGWELIEDARQQGERQITCEIIHTSQDSEIDIALWKISVRMRPPGGTCSYAESVRNVRQVFDIINAAQEDPKIYDHGGDRRSQEFSSNPEENIRILLERRLGKKVKTINKYLNHSQFLDDSTLEILIGAAMKKDFFEEAQPKKRLVIRDLKIDGRSDEAITNEVSRKMIPWLEQYEATGKISSEDQAPDDNDLESGNDDAGDENIIKNPSNTLKTFTPWQGRDESDPQSMPSEEGIKRAIDMATIPLIRCRNRSPLDLELLLNLIPEMIEHLVDATKMAMYIINSKSKDKEE
jgi:hypothetical protein